MEKNKYVLEKKELPYDILFDIFEKSPVAITVVDKDGFIIICNKFAKIIYGRTKKEMYKKHVSILYPKKEWENMIAEKIREKTIKTHYETKIIKKNNEVVDIDISIIVVKNKSGNIHYSIGIARDITGRKKTQKQLREKIDDLELFKQAVVDRELKMIKLEKELEVLKNTKDTV